MSVLVVFATMFFNIEYTYVFYPLFALFLFLYHYRATEKFNVYFLIYLTSLMLAEIGFMIGFAENINLLSLLNIISQISFLILLKPVVKIKLKSFSNHNLTELIIGFLGVSYILGYVLYLVFPLIPGLTLFFPSLIAFFITVILCVGIPFFNKHPDNIMLWGVGIGLIAEMCCSFIFEYVSDHRAYIVMSHIFGAFLKIVFAIYLTRIMEIKDFDDDHYI